MHNKFYKKAFTLVELIVVITILSVLATVAFISFQGYAASSRDSVRLADTKNMEKVLSIFKETTGKYPIPNESTSITYSGSTAWTQGVFGKNAYSNNISMSNVPIDPLTQLAYAYSITNKGLEYEIAAVLENPVSSTNTQTYAGNQIGSVYVKGDYNGKFLNVQTGSLDYLLGVPSIIASDITSVDVMDIINNKRLVYKGYNNLPASFSGSIYNNNGGFDFTPNRVVLFAGNIDSFQNNPVTRFDFLDNLEENYLNTEIDSESEIVEILNISSGSPSVADNYITNILNNTLKTSIEIKKITNNSVDIPPVIQPVICENLIGTPYGQQINVYNNESNKFAHFIIPQSHAFDFVGGGGELPPKFGGLPEPDPTIYYIPAIDLCDNVDLGLNTTIGGEITDTNIVDVYKVNLTADEEFEITISSPNGGTPYKEVYIFDKDANGLAYTDKPLYVPTYTGIHYITVSPSGGNPAFNGVYNINLKLNLNVAAPAEETF